MRVVVTSNVTADEHALSRFGSRMDAKLAHRVEDTSLDWFEAIEYAWQGSTGDYREGVIEISLLRSVTQRNGFDRLSFEILKQLFCL